MSTNIKVCVRVRPENERERALSQRPVVEVIDESVLIFDPVYEESVSYFHGKVLKDPTSKKPREAKFAFDRVFASSATNIEVYEQTTKAVLKHLLDGYNCSVFAYGATGAGKTFSMLGSAQTPGVIFLSMMDLYNMKESAKDQRDIEISVSYLEVYNENIKDLLSPSGANLPIRDNGKEGIAIPGLTVKEPNSAEELLQMLEKGNKSRTQHPTDANAESSRSHAIFQVFVRVKNRSAEPSQDIQISKLSLIDLAGSERATVTKNRGARFREGANINKSLLALGNVINALADTKRKGSKHVPYRNSKLTRILKDSLGENCKTVMLAAVSPARLSYEDTYNTLSYANRAKKIKAVVKRNVVSLNPQVQNHDLQVELSALKQKLQMQSVQLAQYASKELMAAPAEVNCSFDIDELQMELSQAYGERRRLRDDILHWETMKKHQTFTAIRKQQILDRLELVSCSSHKAGTKTVNKVRRAIDAANKRLQNLERSRKQEEQLLLQNTAKLKALVERGNTVDKPCAQAILSLQMKAYNYEQESREWQKQNQHMTRLINTLHDSQKSHERMVQTFVQFLGTSQSLLSNYGLHSDDLSDMYRDIKQCIINEHHVSFTSEEPLSSGNEETLNSIAQLPVLSADESSLQITGKPILGKPPAYETPEADLNSTFTKAEPSGGNKFIMDDSASPPLRETATVSSVKLSPPPSLPSSSATTCSQPTTDDIASESSQLTQTHSPLPHNHQDPQATQVDCRLSLSPKFTAFSLYSRSVFKPVEQVLGLGAPGCAASNDESPYCPPTNDESPYCPPTNDESPYCPPTNDESPYCPPTKLRRISRSPSAAGTTTDLRHVRNCVPEGMKDDSVARSHTNDTTITISHSPVQLTHMDSASNSSRDSLSPTQAGFSVNAGSPPRMDSGAHCLKETRDNLVERELFHEAKSSTPSAAAVPRYLQMTKATQARQVAKENRL